jgi:hypothetical protein
MFVRLSSGMCHGRPVFRQRCAALSEELLVSVISADSVGSSSFCNVGRYIPDSIVSHPRTSYLHSQYCET